MKKVLVIAIMVAVATAATSKDFVNEGFEGSSFPPAGWKVKYVGNASWHRASGGPWGYYAYGNAGGWEVGHVWATLISYEFDVRPGTRVYYRFDFQYNVSPGHGSCLAEFYFASAGTLAYWELPVTGNRVWKPLTGNVVFNHGLGGRVNVCWRLSVECFWRGQSALWFVDRIIISDVERFPAVTPNSLGRVKALFK